MTFGEIHFRLDSISLDPRGRVYINSVNNEIAEKSDQ